MTRGKSTKGKNSRPTSSDQISPRSTRSPLVTYTFILITLATVYVGLTRVADSIAPTSESLPVARQIAGAYSFSGGGARGGPTSNIGSAPLYCSVGYFYQASACRLDEQYRGQLIVATVLDLPVWGGTKPLTTQIEVGGKKLYSRTPVQSIEIWERATTASIRILIVFLAVILSALPPIVRKFQKAPPK